MFRSGEWYWQAWQQTQRIYRNPDNAGAFIAGASAVSHLFEPTDTEQYPGPFSEDKVISAYFDAINTVDPDVAYDLRQRIDQLASLAGRICTIRYAQRSQIIKFEYHDRAEVLSSGLELSAMLAQSQGRNNLHPMLELHPRGEAQDVAYVAMDWNLVREIRVLE